MKSNLKVVNSHIYSHFVTEEEDMPMIIKAIEKSNIQISGIHAFELIAQEFGLLVDKIIEGMKSRILSERKGSAMSIEEKKAKSFVDEWKIEVTGSQLFSTPTGEGEEISTFGDDLPSEDDSDDEKSDFKAKPSMRLFGKAIKHEQQYQVLMEAKQIEIDNRTSELLERFDKNPEDAFETLVKAVLTTVVENDLLKARVLELENQQSKLMEVLTNDKTEIAGIKEDVLVLTSELENGIAMMDKLRTDFKAVRKVVKSLTKGAGGAIGEGVGSASISIFKRIAKSEIDSAIKLVREEFNGIIGEHLESETDSIVKKIASAIRGMEEFEKLEDRLGLLESKVSSIRTEHEMFDNGDDEGNEKDRETDATLANIECELALMKSRLGEKTLIFESIELGSFADTLFFVNDNLPIMSYGCFFDLVALLDSLRDTQTSTADYAAQEHAAQKSKFLSTAEVSTSASFLHIAPLCFAGSKAESSGNHGTVAKSLPLIKEREMWQDESGVLGLSRRLDKEVSAKVVALERDIEANLGDSKGAMLARKYLFATHKCWEKMSV